MVNGDEAVDGDGNEGVHVSEGDLAAARRRMIEEQLVDRGIRDHRVLAAMAAVPRERFVAPDLARYAYDDGPLPIPEAQTISQPYIVARMVEALDLTSDDKVLEVGTGSGYAAAVLAALAREVHTIERHRVLADEAAARLADLGFGHVHVHVGDGTLGWPEAAPYDAIVVAASGPDVPPALLEQIGPGGRLVIPVGPDAHEQDLWRVERMPDDRLRRSSLGPVRFVPLIGEEGWSADEGWSSKAPRRGRGGGQDEDPAQETGP